MGKTIITKNQRLFLEVFAKEKKIAKDFYLAGGTALSEFYLHHRYSEDLDFFSEKEFTSQVISVFLKKSQKNLGIKKIDYQQSFNRHLFFLYFTKDIIKTEFTFFPFTPIKKGITKNNIRIDSLLDIAVNKLFTIYQKPRSRDFIDLYFIIKKQKWSIDALKKKARIKFDWHIDPLQLGSQFLQVTKVKDYPRMIKKLNHKQWQNFFVKEAKKLGHDILKST